MNNYDRELAALFADAAERKEELQSDIDLILSINEKARREGLLAVEGLIPDLPSPFMKLAVRLMVDGTDSELIRKVLSTARHADNHTGPEQVRRMLIEEGILAVLEGLPTSTLKALLYAYLGENKAYSEIREY